MGWKRINGNDYYYRSVRSGGKVVSEYFGGGEAAGLIARIEAIEREQKEALRHDEKTERERADREERELSEWFDRIEAAADLAMEAAGYHRHKGQWRRRRDVRGPSSGR
jgi:hypothetical protein